MQTKGLSQCFHTNRLTGLQKGKGQMYPGNVNQQKKDVNAHRTAILWTDSHSQHAPHGLFSFPSSSCLYDCMY
jgi:hypothetical protein